MKFVDERKCLQSDVQVACRTSNSAITEVRQQGHGYNNNTHYKYTGKCIAPKSYTLGL